MEIIIENMLKSANNGLVAGKSMQQTAIYSQINFFFCKFRKILAIFSIKPFLLFSYLFSIIFFIKFRKIAAIYSQLNFFLQIHENSC